MKTRFITTVGCAWILASSASAHDPFAPGLATHPAAIERDEKSQKEIPAKYRAIEGVSIQYEKCVRRVATYHIVNNTNETVFFSCGGIENPLEHLEVLADGKWSVPKGRMRCGTGVYLGKLAAKKSVKFEVNIPLIFFPVRVGVDFYGPQDASGNRQLNTRWATPIKLKG